MNRREGGILNAELLGTLRKQAKLSIEAFDLNNTSDKVDLLHPRSFGCCEKKDDAAVMNVILINNVKYYRIKSIKQSSPPSQKKINTELVELIKDKILPDFNKKYAADQEIKNLLSQIVDDAKEV